MSTIARGTIPQTRYTNDDLWNGGFIQIVTASNSLYTMTQYDGGLFKGDDERVMTVVEAWIPRDRRERALFIGYDMGTEVRVSTSPVHWYYCDHTLCNDGIGRDNWVDVRDQFTIRLANGEVPHVGQKERQQ